MSSDSEFDYHPAPSSAIPSQIGRIIDDGRLQIRELIGRGGWGAVYLAVTNEPLPGQPEEQFAVKAIRHQDMLPHHLLALSREIRLHELCSKASNRVVKFHKVLEDEDDELFFLITEYCPEGDLLDMIFTDRYVGDDELTRDIFVQILDAVQDLHRAQVFHRDLKPENILSKDNGTKIVIADFGFATRERRTSEFRIGSEPFMSPDVRGGLHFPFFRTPYCTRRADVWALGIILLNLICGCCPWNKASTSDPDFLTYLIRDRQYLLRVFPITEEVNCLLQKILTPEAENRISIAVLRDEVMKIQKFSTMEKGMTLRDAVDSEIMETSLFTDSGSSLVGPLRMSTGPNAPRFAPPMLAFPPPPLHPDRRRPSSIPTLVDSDPESEPEIIEAPAFGLAPLPVQPILSTDFVIVSHEELDDLGSVIGDEDTGEDSDADSEGLITPEQRAADADPAVVSSIVLEDVPDLGAMNLDDEFDLGTSMVPISTPPLGRFRGRKANADVGLVMVNAKGITPSAFIGATQVQGPSSAKQALRGAAKRMGDAVRKLQAA